MRCCYYLATTTPFGAIQDNRSLYAWAYGRPGQGPEVLEQSAYLFHLAHEVCGLCPSSKDQLPRRLDAQSFSLVFAHILDSWKAEAITAPT